MEGLSEVKKLYQFMEKTDTKIGRTIDSVIIVFIVMNILIVILDSYGSIRTKYDLIISSIEILSVIIFSIEYLLRLIVSPYRYGNVYKPILVFKYVITPMALIDLLAILPFYLPIVLIFDFRVLRVLRLFRLLRILKLKRYSKAIDLILNVFKKKKAELLLSTFILTILVFFAGSLMYFSENELQPNIFPNIIESVLWSIRTMVFLGYEESKPVSQFGNIIGMGIIVFGLGWLTLPISILSSGFVEEVHISKGKCPHCGKDL